MKNFKIECLIDFGKCYAAIWRSRSQQLKPVIYLDTIGFDGLVGIEEQKARFIDNTERFLKGLPANNILLWGARGTGKSSLIKAMLQCYKTEDLRVIEIDRDDLDILPELSDWLRELPYRFIIFCDDLSFEENERGYRGLKRILEGSIEAAPENIKVYATSNRRHMIAEFHSENSTTQVTSGREIHYHDSVEEKISLSDRFGLWISFYQGTQKEYLQVVDHYFHSFTGDRKVLHQEALRFSQSRASRSARTAQQFFNSFSQKNN